MVLVCSLYRFSALVRRLCFLIVAAFAAQMLPAQTISFLSAVSIAASGFNNAQSVAVDSAGTLYIADTNGSQIVKVAPDGTQSILKTGNLSLSTPYGVALDAAGDVFIADTGNNRIVKVTVDGSASVLNTGGYQLNLPTGIAVDTAGNVYVVPNVFASPTESGPILKISTSGNTSPVNTGSIALNICTDVAVDNLGNLYITDYEQGTHAGRVIKVAAGGSASLVDTNGLTLNAPQGIAVDQAGNLYIADTYDGHVIAVPTGGDAYVVKTGATSYDTPDVAAGSNGVIYILQDLNQDFNGTNVDQLARVQLRTADFGTANVCPAGQSSPAPCSQTLTLNFGFSTATDLGTPRFSNSEFSIQAGICSGSFQSGDECKLTVNFVPSSPGVQMGAVELVDTNGNLLHTSYISGLGDAPAVGFLPGTPSVLQAGNQSIVLPGGVAIDQKGNRYIADRSRNQIFEVTPAGTTTTVSTGSLALSQPNGVALDGANTLYIADTGNNRIVMVTANGNASILSTGSLTLHQPQSVAVDGSGDVYIASTGDNHIAKVTASGSASTLDTGGIPLQQPQGVALDAAGSLYVASTGNSSIIKVTASGGASILNTGGVTLQQPEGLAMDAAGTLYIADSAANQIVQVSASETVSIANTGNYALNQPSSVALDTSGNLFIADAGNSRVLAIDRTTPPSLSFPQTSVGAVSSAQIVTLTNFGNTNLVLPGPATGTNPSLSANFVLSSSSTCPSLSGPVFSIPFGTGMTCSLSISFAPESIGSVSGSLVLTDNTGNASSPYATQSIALNSTAVGSSTALTLLGNLSSSVYGQAVTFQATITAAGSLPAGTIAFYDGSVVLGTVPFGTNGIASITTASLSVGTHSITAKYAGGGNFLSASSPVLTQIVGKAASTVALSTSNATPYPGDSITLTAMVTSTAGVPSGSVQFLDGSSVLGTAPLNTQGTAVFTASLAAGTHTIDAIYAGDQNFLASQNTITEQANAGTISLSLNKNTLTLRQGNTGTLTALLLPQNGYKGTITFSCSGLPQTATCSFNPGTMTANGTKTPMPATLTITTNATGAEAASLGQAQTPANRTALAGLWLLPAGIFGAWWMWHRRRLQAAGHLFALLILLGCAIGIMGCGINFNGFGTTSTVTVQAVDANGANATTTFTLQTTK
jgi:sugar lactone lactonase YvrE